MNVDLSVVIPAYNQAALLKRLLDSLAAMTDAPAWEVIVVDDASPDNTRETVAAWAAAHPEIDCHYIRQDRNQGPGAARNRGTEEARGALVAFADTDCVVSPGWLAALHSALDTDETVVGAGGPVAPHNPENIFAQYNTVNRTLQPQVTREQPIPYLVTCNCCYRREPLLAAGGFTADIPTPGGEDVAASIALYKQGYRFAFASDALVYHDYRDTWRSFLRTWTNYGYGCGLVAQRLLSSVERDPEGGQWDGENHWSVLTLRPTVTGVRSMFRDLRWFWRRCGVRKLSLLQRFQLIVLRAAERIAYLRGWRRGMRQAR